MTLKRLKGQPLLESPHADSNLWVEVKPHMVREIQAWYGNQTGDSLKILQYSACMQKLGIKPTNTPRWSDLDYPDLAEWERLSGNWDTYLEFSLMLREFGADFDPRRRNAASDIAKFLAEEGKRNPWQMLIHAAKAAKSGLDDSEAVKYLQEHDMFSDLARTRGEPKTFAQRAWALHTLKADVRSVVKDEADNLRGQLRRFAEDKDWGKFLLYASDLADLGVLTPNLAKSERPDMPALKRFGGRP